ncbi:PAS domain S-box protein [bacterium]|nr:MAG: PAS domain S-box protein [bacterium]
MSFDSVPDLTLFQAAVQHSYDVVELLQAEGTILYINPAIQRALGFEPHVLVGTNHFDLLHPDDKTRLQGELNAVLAQGHGELSPYRCRANHDGWRWFQSTASCPAPQTGLSSSDAPTLILNSRDISEQKEVQSLVVQPSREMQDIWESMTDAFFALDNQWRFTYLNNAAGHVLQRRVDELLGRNVWEEFPAAVGSLFFEQYNLAMKEQRKVVFEEFYPPLDTWFEVHAYPFATGLAVYFRDITERRLTEDVLRESEQRFRRIFEEGPLAIALVAPDASITHVNARMCQMLDYTEQELTHLNIANITHPDDVNINARETQQLISGEISSYQVEKRYLTRHGETVWGALTGAMIRDDNGNPLYALAIVEDITERKLAQERLSQSEANLAKAQEITRLGIWELDLLRLGDVNSNPLHWSDENFRLFGYEPGEVEVSNESFFNAVHPDDRERVGATMERALRGEGVYNLEHRVIWPDGSEHILHAQADLIRDPDSGQPVKMVGTGLDITQRIRDEETQARLVAIVESSDDAILSKTLEGIITSWNNGATLVFGYTAQEAIGKHIQMLIPVDGVFEGMLLKRVKNGERISNFETRCIHKSGQLIDVAISSSPMFNAAGEIVGVSSVTRDITEKKQAEVEREQSLVLLQSTLEATADGILVVNDEGKLTHYNRQFVNMWRIPDEIMQSGENAQAVEFVKSQLSDPEEFAASAYSSSSEREREGFDLLHFKDGRVFERYSKAQKLREKELGWVWSFRDITEKIRLAQEQIQLNQQLEDRVARRTAELGDKNRSLEAEVAERRMAVGALREVVEMLKQANLDADRANRAKSEFLSRMSHELRTPMNAILGFGQLLEMSQLGPNDRVGVEQILQAGHHLLQLINEVLEIARIEAGHVSLSMEPVEVLSMIRDAMNLVQPLAKQRQITLLCDIDSIGTGEHYVMGDKTRLHQVMINLLSNAVKYNRDGGNVTLSLQEITLGSQATLDSLRILVTDTGFGIAPADQQRIFLPFERLKADTTTTEGTGIGLTLTKNLVELMGGTVGLDSELGHGSTFWIELPAAEKPAPALPANETPLQWADNLFTSLNRPLTFLYIEDNEFNIKLMEALLERAPQVRLLTAINGNSGLKLASQHNIDLILLDLHLPDIDGSKVLRRLQQDAATSGIPVIMVSADATPTQINSLLVAGARHYLTKPFAFRQFVQVVEDVLKTQIP